MNKIIVQLPANRDYAGRLELQNAAGKRLAGPFKVCGRADDQSAQTNKNPTRNPLLPFGDTPFGEYSVVKIMESGPGTSYGSDEFGSAGLVLLQPKKGDAELADANGRFGFFIQGGARPRSGLLRPTLDGSLRLSDGDLRKLISTIRQSGEVRSVCTVISTGKAGAKIAIAPEKQVARSRRNLPASLLLASSVLASQVTGTIRQALLRTALHRAEVTIVTSGLFFVTADHVSASPANGDYTPTGGSAMDQLNTVNEHSQDATHATTDEEAHDKASQGIDTPSAVAPPVDLRDKEGTVSPTAASGGLPPASAAGVAPGSPISSPTVPVPTPAEPTPETTTPAPTTTPPASPTESPTTSTETTPETTTPAPTTTPPASPTESPTTSTETTPETTTPAQTTTPPASPTESPTTSTETTPETTTPAPTTTPPASPTEPTPVSAVTTPENQSGQEGDNANQPSPPAQEPAAKALTDHENEQLANPPPQPVPTPQPNQSPTDAQPATTSDQNVPPTLAPGSTPSDTQATIASVLSPLPDWPSPPKAVCTSPADMAEYAKANASNSEEQAAICREANPPGTPGNYGCGRCVHFIVKTINENSDYDEIPLVPRAKDLGDYLKPAVGWNKVDIDLTKETPKDGDVAVIQAIPNSKKYKDGHAEIYYRNGWVSDYIQENNTHGPRGVYPNDAYAKAKASYTIYRYTCPPPSTP